MKPGIILPFEAFWSKLQKHEYKRSWLIALNKIYDQNFLGGSKFKYSHFELRDVLNKYVENITLADLEKFSDKLNK